MSATGRGADYFDLGAYYTEPALPRVVLEAFYNQLHAQTATCAAGLWRDWLWLDPQVGGGAWLMPLYELGFAVDGGANLEVMDIDPLARGLELPGDHVRTPCAPSLSLAEAGFIVTEPARRPDVVLGNPPYALPVPCPKCAGHKRACPKGKGCRGSRLGRPLPVAELHVRRALEISRRHVLQLLPSSFLGSVERERLYLEHPPRHLWQLTPRVQFRAVCLACAGTGIGRRGDCDSCEGSGRRRGESGSDSTEPVVVWWDHLWTGPTTWSRLRWKD